MSWAQSTAKDIGLKTNIDESTYEFMDHLQQLSLGTRVNARYTMRNQKKKKSSFRDVPSVEFMYLVFRCTLVESYCRRIRSRLLCPLSIEYYWFPLFVDATHALWASCCFRVRQTDWTFHRQLTSTPQWVSYFNTKSMAKVVSGRNTMYLTKSKSRIHCLGHASICIRRGVFCCCFFGGREEEERERRESENRKGRIRGSGQSMGFVKLHSDLPQSLFDPMVLKIVECVSHRVPTQYNNGTIFGDTVVHVVGEKAIYPLGQIGTRPLPVGNSVAAKYYIYFKKK